MAGFASQAALRSHYEDLIDKSEEDIEKGLRTAVSWFKQVFFFLIFLCNANILSILYNVVNFSFAHFF